jgi:short-subunit dehydrogenase
MNKAIVIGATSGIGKELAIILAKRNNNVCVTGRRADLLHTIRADNPDQIQISAFDCTNEDNAKKLSEMVKKLGGLDLLVFSAGTGHINENLDFDLENETNRLNVMAFTEIVDWAFNYFQKQNYGHIAVISSIAGLRGSRVAPAYNASKAFQINYLEGLRQKAHQLKKPIIITDIRPGFVDTAMAKGEGQFWVASKEKAAKQIYNHIKGKKQVAYVTKRWQLIAFILKIVPRFLYKKF